MTIKEFIEIMQNNDHNATISDIVATKRYITSADKVSVAEEVVDLSVDYDRGFIKFDRYKKHLAFIFESIEAHTNLIFADDWPDKIQEYDMLCEKDLLDAIIDTFRKDYNASRDVLDMMCADMLAENSIESSIVKLAQSASENLDVFVGTLSDKIEELDIEKIIPKDLDLDKLKGLLSKLK